MRLLYVEAISAVPIATTMPPIVAKRPHCT